MKRELIPLSDINPYDHIHFPTLEGWLSVEGYTQQHLLDDYIYHLQGILWGIKEFLSGREILPILVTPIENNPLGLDRFQRRDGYKRFKVYEYLNRLFIPCFIATEEEAQQFPQKGLFFEDQS